MVNHPSAAVTSDPLEARVDQASDPLEDRVDQK
jgi:hypothetical protein